VTKYEIEAIKQTFLDVFTSGYIYLFGSRVDDSARGGDIDLFIQTDNGKLINKIKFLAILKEKIGDQKIDVIISKDKSRVIEKEALRTGVLL